MEQVRSSKIDPSTPITVKKLALSTFLVLALTLTWSSARTWTQASTGKTLEGKLTKVDGENILITRTNGTSLKVPIKMLSEGDKKFIADWQKEKEGSPAPGDAEETPKKEPIPEGETKLVLSDVHLVCNGCKSAVESASGSLTNVTVTAGRRDVTIEGATGELVKTAMAYVMQRGFYGTPSISAYADTKKYSTEKKEMLTVSRLPLYCGKCVDEVEDVLKSVDGVKEIEGLERRAKDVILKGETSPADVIAALHEAGIHAAVR